jgi:hypothetical protein
MFRFASDAEQSLVEELFQILGLSADHMNKYLVARNFINDALLIG